MNNKDSILITGSSGQLAKEIKFLTKSTELFKNYRLLFLSKNSLDITKEDEVDTIFKTENIRAVINCAAYTNVDKAEEEAELCFKVNNEGVRNLVKNASSYKCRMIHISTDYVFNGNKSIPWSEKDVPDPLNTYGKSKFAAENLITSSNINFAIIRTSWLYSTFCNNFFNSILRKIDNDEDLEVVDDQIGSPTFAGDLAFFSIQILKKMFESHDFREIFHYSNSGEASWFDFAVAIKKIHKANAPIAIKRIKSSSLKLNAKRPKYTVLNNSKAENFLGRYIENWESSLKKCYKFYLERPL